MFLHLEHRAMAPRWPFSAPVLENPLRTQKEIAKATAYSPSQVSRIMSSPAFLERYEVIFRGLAGDARSTWLAHLREQSANNNQPKD